MDTVVKNRWSNNFALNYIWNEAIPNLRQKKCENSFVLVETMNFHLKDCEMVVRVKGEDFSRLLRNPVFEIASFKTKNCQSRVWLSDKKIDGTIEMICHVQDIMEIISVDFKEESNQKYIF